LNLHWVVLLRGIKIIIFSNFEFKTINYTKPTTANLSMYLHIKFFKYWPMIQFFFLILYYFTYYFNLFFLLSLFCFNLTSFVKLLFLLDNRNCHNRQKNQIKNTREISKYQSYPFKLFGLHQQQKTWNLMLMKD